MKKYFLFLLAALFFAGAGVARLQAQDTILVELDEDISILIYTKDKGALHSLKTMDLNDLIEEIIAENIEAENDKKVYEYVLDENELALSKMTLQDRKSGKIRIYDYEDPTAKPLAPAKPAAPEKMVIKEVNLNGKSRTTTTVVDAQQGFGLKYHRQSTVSWHFAAGFNNYLEGNYEFPAQNDRVYALDPLRSNFYAISFMLNKSMIGGRRGGIFLQAGLELGLQNLRFQNNTYIASEDQGVAFKDYEADFGIGLKKSRLNNTYLTLPVGLSYKSRYGLVLGAHVFGSYLLQSTAFTLAHNGAKEEKSGNFYINNFQYGGEVSIGTPDFKIFGRYTLTPLYNTNRGPELNTFVVGVRW